MTYEGYVEIGQDAAGIIEANGVANGLFTDKVETCLVAVFQCAKATIMLHDSGRLKLSQIFKLIKKYGSVTKVSFILSADYDNRHDERMRRIRKDAGARNEVLRASGNGFAVACSKLGQIQILDVGQPEGVEALPDRAAREAVCRINNCFLERNAQNLALDIQYAKGVFAEQRTIDKTMTEILDMVKAQPEFFYMNLAVLGNAQSLGILQLPDTLYELYERHNLARFMMSHLTPIEQVQQAAEFRGYR